MFGIAPSELMLLAIVTLVVVGPKDLPRVMRVAGVWIGRARGMAAQLKSGLDEVVREAELADLEQHWKAENERILEAHGAALLTIGAKEGAEPQHAASSLGHPAPPIRTGVTAEPQEIGSLVEVAHSTTER